MVSSNDPLSERLARCAGKFQTSEKCVWVVQGIGDVSIAEDRFDLSVTDTPYIYSVHTSNK